MTKNEYERLKAYNAPDDVIHVNDLVDTTPRLLIDGFTCDDSAFFKLSLTVHGTFNLKISGLYAGDDIIENLDIPSITPLYCIPPDGRVNWQTSDYEFCMLLKARGIHVPFTTF